MNSRVPDVGGDDSWHHGSAPLADLPEGRGVYDDDTGVTSIFLKVGQIQRDGRVCVEGFFDRCASYGYFFVVGSGMVGVVDYFLLSSSSKAVGERSISSSRRVDIYLIFVVRYHPQPPQGIEMPHEPVPCFRIHIISVPVLPAVLS